MIKLFYSPNGLSSDTGLSGAQPICDGLSGETLSHTGIDPST